MSDSNTPAGNDRRQTDPLTASLERVMADPEARARFAASVAEMVGSPQRGSWWNRHQQFFAGLVSASVVLLAFLIPSLQEQWDRMQSRAAIDRYEAIGKALLARGQYASAEQSFDTALQMSDGRRVDLLESRLRAHVARVNENGNWLGKVPEGVTESDFVYLLELQANPDKSRDRAATLAAYADFLASSGRLAEAEQRLRESLRLDPGNVAALVDLGNLLADSDRVADAERSYRTALQQAPQSADTRFDLALLLRDAGRCAEVVPLLQPELDKVGSGQPASWELLADCYDSLGRAGEAATARAKAALQRKGARSERLRAPQPPPRADKPG